ncbi:MAG: hypothetical protein ABR880_02570 [Candidatus Sulfotelmatobacter sp.]
MDWKNPLHGLQVDDNFIIDDQIYLVSAFQLQAFVRDGEIDLAFKGQSAKVQFVAQTLFVGRFEQSGSELAEDLDGRPND